MFRPFGVLLGTLGDNAPVLSKEALLKGQGWYLCVGFCAFVVTACLVRSFSMPEVV